MLIGMVPDKDGEAGRGSLCHDEAGPQEVITAGNLHRSHYRLLNDYITRAKICQTHSACTPGPCQKTSVKGTRSRHTVIAAQRAVRNPNVLAGAGQIPCDA